MNETIGSKGGRQDKKRTIIITKAKKKKLQENFQKKKQEKLKKLEKEVKNLQVASLFFDIPISIGGNIIETVLNTRISKNEERKEEKSLEIEELHQADKKELFEGLEEKNIHPVTEVEVKEIKQDRIPIKEVEETAPKDEFLKKEADKKIVSNYENRFKEIKREFKNIIYETTVLEEQSNQVPEKKTAEDLLNQVNTVIEKLEELKEKIKIDLEDNQELTDLIDSYMDEFKNKQEVESIKDSNLYILLAGKVEEAKLQAINLSEKVEIKKDKLELNEEQFNLLKERFNSFENFNNQLIAFQNDQDNLLIDLEEKVKNSVSITEKATYQVKAMNKQSKKLLSLLTLPMLIPGNRSAKVMASSTAAYIYFLKQILSPKYKKKRYRVIEVTNYQKELEENLIRIDNTIDLLLKTSKKIEEMINQIEIEFQNYEIPEYQELIGNLKKIRKEMQEKEEELKKTKQKQEKLLEENKEKVKTMSKVEEM